MRNLILLIVLLVGVCLGGVVSPVVGDGGVVGYVGGVGAFDTFGGGREVFVGEFGPFGFTRRFDSFIGGDDGCYYGIGYDQTSDDSYSYFFHYWDGAEEYRSQIYGSNVEPSVVHLLMDSAGSRGLLYSGIDSQFPPQLVDIICEGGSAHLANRVDLAFANDTSIMPAFSGDGTVIYYYAKYADSSAGYSNENTLWLKRYDVSTGQIDTVPTAANGDYSLGTYADAATMNYALMVACSADGNVVAYVDTKGSDALGVSIYNTAGGSWSHVRLGSDAGLAGCRRPAVSANGRFVLFISDSGLHLYDTTSKALTTLVTGGGIVAAGLSPSAKYAAYITAAGTVPTTVVTGASFVDIASAVVVAPVGDDAKVVLPVTCSQDQVSKLSFTLDGEACTPDYDEETGAFSLSFASLKEGDKKTLEVLVAGVEKKTITILATSAELLGKGDKVTPACIGVTTDGATAVFTSGSQLSLQDTDDKVDVYTMALSSGGYRLISTSETNYVYDAAISGDGQTALWRNSADAVVVNGAEVFPTVSTKTAAVVSEDGGVLAAVTADGQLDVSPDGGDSVTATNVSCKSGTALVISSDGRLVWFVNADGALCQWEVSGGISRTVVDSGVEALLGGTRNGAAVLVKNSGSTYSMVDSTGAKSAVGGIPSDASEVRLSGNGRYVFYRSASGKLGYVVVATGAGVDTGIAAASTGNLAAGANGQRCLFSFDGYLAAYQVPGWSNAAPVVTTLVCDEDTETTWPLADFVTDADNDALVVTLVAGATNGQAQLLPPDKTAPGYRLRYLGTLNFFGSDAVTIRVDDGTTTAEHQVAITVNNVNDAPVISEATPTTMSVTAGCNETLGMSANDVDGDTLTWSAQLLESADPTSQASDLPQWLTIDATTGTVAIRSPLDVDGEVLYVKVSAADPAGASGYVVITVTFDGPPPTRTFSKALLTETPTTPPAADASAAEQWFYAVAGCWKDVPDGWQALSLPAPAKVADVANVLGTTTLWRWKNGTYFASPATDTTATLYPGEGFWANVNWSNSTNSITLTAASYATPAHSPNSWQFKGPLVDTPTTSPNTFTPTTSWSHTTTTKIGHAYFTYLPAPAGR